MKSLKSLKFAVKPWCKNLPKILVQKPFCYGLFGELAVIFANFMGHAYQFVPSYETGGLLANGSRTGLMGSLSRSEADIALSYFVLEDKANESLFPFEFGEVTFATKKPTPSPNPAAVFQPFSTFVWFSLAVSILAMAKAYLHFFKNLTFPDSVFSVLATALRQAPSFYPKTYPERILMGSWLFGMTITTACYMSVLLSYLTIPNLLGVKTIPELANAIEKGDYQCFFTENDYFGFLLLNSHIKAHRIIGKNLIATQLYKFRRSSVSNAAFIFSRQGLQLQAPELFVSENSFFTFMSSFPIRNGFPFKDELDWAMLRLIETGILDQMNKRHFYKPRGFDEEQLTRKLTLLDFKSVFIMLLMGYGVSFLILLLEMLALKLKHLVKRKNRNC